MPKGAITHAHLAQNLTFGLVPFQFLPFALSYTLASGASGNGVVKSLVIRIKGQPFAMFFSITYGFRVLDAENGRYQNPRKAYHLGGD